MSGLFDVDRELSGVDVASLRATVSNPSLPVSTRGRAVMEMARRTADAPDLLPEVKNLISDTSNREAITVGTTTVSQLGVAGLVVSGSRGSRALAEELAREWNRNQQDDFDWLMKRSGIKW